MLGGGALSSLEITSALLARVEAIDSGGPRLASVLAVNDHAESEAGALDAERRAGHLRGPLHGLPVLIKDNIDTAGLATTAGSCALAGWAPAADAPLVAALRQAGAVVLGKANLSEWANFRGRPSSSGWSAVGGQTLNPHALDRSPGGSSAGSAAAVAAGLVPLAVGTETDGSITCPAACCGIVGLKPTLGLVSRTGIVPIAASQDTAGPMGRCVADVAMMLSAMAAAVSDDEDPRQAGRPWDSAAGMPDYSARLSGDLTGMRVGLTNQVVTGQMPAVASAFDASLQALRSAGATLVEVPAIAASGDDELIVLQAEFKAGLAAYLSRRAAGRKAAGLAGEPLVRNLDDVVRFTREHDAELPGQFPIDLLEASASACTLDDEVYLAARERNWHKTRAGVDGACAEWSLDALATPAMPPSCLIDHVTGDHFKQSGWSVPAIAGYPSIAVPSGMVNGLPVATILFGPAWSEPLLLRLAFAVEAQLGLELWPSWRSGSSLVAP